ncbi:hypothetical protein [Streptomyces azureus]|uniref:hypothetical protein n=1 Tax=Streptomyces azureus TaxID=146537 RepID=UPI003C2F796E
MRPRRFVPFAVLAVCLAGCGGVDGGVRVEGPAVTSVPWTGPVYVTDYYGRSWQRPSDISPTPDIDLQRLTWRDWGSPRARATGVVVDAGCGADCLDGELPGYRARVVLSDLVKRGSVAFYSQVTLTPVHPPAPSWAKGTESAYLDVPDA